MPHPDNPDAAPQAGPIGLLLSGGLDSAILLVHLLRQGERVQPLYVRSHLVWEGAELKAVERFLRSVAQGEAGLDPGARLAPLVTLDQPVQDLYGSHWSVTGRGTPDGSTPDEAVFLPGRNPLLLMKAGLWCQLHHVPRLALAPLHSNPFPDASPEFFDGFAALLSRALDVPLTVMRPFAQLTKREVMELGRGTPWQHTFSCIAPVGHEHCGACNKCAERQAAFAAIGAADPTCYARGERPS